MKDTGKYSFGLETGSGTEAQLKAIIDAGKRVRKSHLSGINRTVNIQ